MGRILWNLAFGAAVVAGGVYLYNKKSKSQKNRRLLAHATGIVVGDKVGGLTGFILAGPGGALVGSVGGAVAGALTAENYLCKDEATLPEVSKRSLPRTRQSTATKREATKQTH